METNITVEEYDTITLQCNVSNSIPKADLTWVELIKPYVPTTVYPSTTPSLNATTTTSIANSTVNATTTPMNTTVTMTTAATTTVAGQMTANWLNTSIPANIIKVRSLLIMLVCLFHNHMMKLFSVRIALDEVCNLSQIAPWKSLCYENFVLFFYDCYDFYDYCHKTLVKFILNCPPSCAIISTNSITIQ